MTRCGPYAIRSSNICLKRFTDVPKGEPASGSFRFFFSFFPSHSLSSPFYSLSLLVVTQIRGHIAGSFPTLPTTVRALHLYREKISPLSSLVDSRRLVLTHARRSQQLILFENIVFANKFNISPRRDSNSRTNTLL